MDDDDLTIQEEDARDRRKAARNRKNPRIDEVPELRDVLADLIADAKRDGEGWTHALVSVELFDQAAGTPEGWRRAGQSWAVLTKTAPKESQ